MSTTTSDSDKIPCPFCGELHGDLWDYSWGVNVVEIRPATCGSCGKTFRLTRRVRIDYLAEAP